MTMNKILIIGNLGSDPEMRYTPSGSAVTSFTVATNRRYRTSDGENREETEWFRISAWNRLAETCNQYLQRGSKVYVEGELQTRKWQDQDGNDKYTTEVILQGYNSNLTLLDSRNNTNQSSEITHEPSTANENTETQTSDSEDSEEDIPF